MSWLLSLPRPHRVRTTVVLCGVFLLPAPSPATAQHEPAPLVAQRVVSIGGFEAPESVRFDAEQEVFFVSNIVGNPSEKDGLGYISRLTGEGRMEERRFIEGGRAGVVLHAPKGMVIAGDTLWVADIDAVRGFDRRTGAPLATVDLAGHHATFLNDIAVGGEGALYVTDSGISIDSQGAATPAGAQRIFRIRGREVGLALEGEALAVPNGIAVGRDGSLVLAPIGGTAVQRWRAGEPAPSVIASGPGAYDGIEVLWDGRVVVSSWADGTVYELRGTSLHPLVREVPSPADLGVDHRRRHLAIPLLLENRVEIWALVPGGTR